MLAGHTPTLGVHSNQIETHRMVVQPVSAQVVARGSHDAAPFWLVDAFEGVDQRADCAGADLDEDDRAAPNCYEIDLAAAAAVVARDDRIAAGAQVLLRRPLAGISNLSAARHAFLAYGCRASPTSFACR